MQLTFAADQHIGKLIDQREERGNHHLQRVGDHLRQEAHGGNMMPPRHAGPRLSESERTGASDTSYGNASHRGSKVGYMGKRHHGAFH